MRTKTKNQITRRWTFNRWIHGISGLAVALSLLVFSAELNAEAVDLRWKPVQGSSGYLVRVQKEDGSTTDTRIGTNRARLDLDPGNYVIRIAGLNKFGKPGPFSDPAKVTIETSSETRTIQMEDAQQETLREEGSEDQQEPSQPYDYSRITYPMALIPGWIQYNRDEPYKLYLFNGLLLGHAYAFHVEKQRGNALSREVWNDPTNILLAANGDRAFLGLMWFRRSAENQKYVNSQFNQKALATSAGIIYILHFVDLYFFSTPVSPSQASQEGLSLDLFAIDRSPPPFSEKPEALFAPDMQARIQWRMHF